MNTFEVISLMISFGMFVIAVLDFHNHDKNS
ncbi:putative holin-like toxin [Fictibacillus fluitans]|uniref:Holin-like toxin n=1 Tax=Fictibacillus fluitans TaxID=3058422 RepID=A0ABT8HTS2_9BACL|nr:putative holin-like toxin [Fictibacillus sp. NE201]MDN4524171.1 putative holin-like toxin [Fictibacillus sp. NE201]